MTVRFELRTTKKSLTGEGAPLHISVSDGRDFRKRQVTQIMIDPAAWDSKIGGLKKRYLINEEDRVAITSEMSNLSNYVSVAYFKAKEEGKVNDSWLLNTVNDYYSGKTLKEPLKSKVLFDDVYDSFLSDREIGEGRRRHYEVLRRMIHRYVSYVRCSQFGRKRYAFDLTKITKETLEDFYDYVENEHEYVRVYPKILEDNPEARDIKPRGENYMSGVFKELRAFFNWAYRSKHITSSPFDGFEMPSEQYGTPVYLTLEDVDIIASADFSDNKDLEIQRDIFVFQCNVGCRVGDLLRLKKSDVIKGAVEYIPSKTIKSRAKTVVVPLNSNSLAIVEKYKDEPGEQLLPFISSQNYNDNIKVILEKAGITYLVTVLDTVTRKEVKVPINEMASSHMARRTFIGNIYKLVKDPNLVSALTGHVEGSRAFTRYRDIDIDMKRDLVKILENRK